MVWACFNHSSSEFYLPSNSSLPLYWVWGFSRYNFILKKVLPRTKRLIAIIIVPLLISVCINCPLDNHSLELDNVKIKYCQSDIKYYYQLYFLCESYILIKSGLDLPGLRTTKAICERVFQPKQPSRRTAMTHNPGILLTAVCGE